MLSTMLDDLFKCPQHLVQQSVENMLNQMLKLFKQAFTLFVQLTLSAPNIHMAILLTLLHIFLKAPVRRICLIYLR